MSGSLKDLTKAVNTLFSSADSSLPLPDDLITIIHAYLDKHAPPDESDSQRLQEELLNIYQVSVLDCHAHLAPFLAILSTIKPAIRGSGRLLQWWDKLSVPVLSNLGQQKGLVAEARDALLGTLVYDEDDGDVDDIKTTSSVMAERLLTLWLDKSKTAAEEFDVHSRFVEGQINQILLAYGKKRPRDFLTLIDTFFREKSNRILTLSLFCEFVRHGPPHLDQILDTPLFENLLRCLQVDTSTRVISLSITALIMILPHIPTSASKHLPALFNIYSRLLFWDRERKKDQDKAMKVDPEQDGATTPTWDKLSYLLENDDETVPELLHYFTFLYGLYPINFMSYVRKPQRYLRHANFPGADDLEVEPTEIQQRSETFRQVHALHPNFFTTTLENELTDSNRWMKSAAADVVAECMSLYSAVDDAEGIPTRSKHAAKAPEHTGAPFQMKPDQDPSTPFRTHSWRNTQASSVAAQNDDFMTKRSLSRLSRRSNSISNSPSIRPVDTRADSPLSPEMLTSPSENQIDELVNTHKSTHGSIYQTLTNDSVNSLALSHKQDNSAMTSFHIDTYLHSLNSRDPVTKSSRSPSIRPASTFDPNLRAAYLHREIQLLRNDLNFERYLKQQHLTAIGQLRNKQIKEARGDAEIQNLINSNAILKSKLVEARSHNLQQKKESEKSRTHSRKWESELGAKLRVLREEQKKWNVERDELKRDLQLAKQRTEKLKNIVINSERRELASQQKVQSVESNLGEMERLQSDIDKLTLSLRSYEAAEYETETAKADKESALKRVMMLEMELQARDNELSKSMRAFEDELNERELDRQSSRDAQGISQRLIDEAMAVSNQRMEHMQKVYDHLLERYQVLEHQVVELLDFKQQHSSREPQALLGGEAYGFSSSPSKYVDPDVMNDPAQSTMLLRCQHDTPDGQSRPFSPQSPSKSGPAGSGSMDSDRLSFDAHGKPKPRPQNFKAQSDMRVYGRGGAQNVGKAKKDKSKDGKDDSKKDKKSSGIRSYRGLI